MVPVPEEHVEAVMNFVLRAMEQAAIEEWNTESLGELWAEADEATRSLLAFTSRASASGQTLDLGEAARQVQLTQRDIMSIVNELAALARDANRPSLLTLQNTTERLPNGRTAERRMVVIVPEVADIVREVERADLLDAAPSEPN